ncbi:MAG: sensor histidine kinase [Saccharofermentans sp.]|nr:sensor histidine kinase [Saccharofermentans sp.]
MAIFGKRYEKNTIQGKMYRLIMQMFVATAVMLIIIIAMIVIRNVMYASVSSNIVKASGFNQDFKNEVDLQMYLYVSGSSDEIPWEDVTAAQELAEELLKNTTDPDSRKAMNNVLTLCDNLTNYMKSIERTERYDERMDQLETNIYGITQLIEDYIYSYLYYEAGEMARIQRELDFWFTFEIIFVFAIALVVVVLTLRKSFNIGRSITEPIVEMNGRVEEIGGGDLSPHTPVSTDDKNLALLSSGIEDMASRLKRQIELNQEEQTKLRDIELSLIQAQINPHFLYNTLDAIVWLIEIGKNEQAEQMVTSLSSYFRSFLSDGRDIVTIAEEKQHIKSYLEIQQVRYTDVMEYDIDIDPAIEDTKIPKLTLQPLVENAIYHGLKPKRGKGLIKVTGRTLGSDVLLVVSDTGLGMSEEELKILKDKVMQDDTSTFGLTAAYKRLKLLYAERCSFEVNSTEGEGTSVSIIIPGHMEVSDETSL